MDGGAPGYTLVIEDNLGNFLRLVRPKDMRKEYQIKLVQKQ